MSLVVLGPVLAFLVLMACWWFGGKPGEGRISLLVALAFTAASLACLMGGPAVLELGLWYANFELALQFDAVGLAFATFTACMVGLVGLFSARYLHREPGFLRFYLLLSLFGAGVITVALAANLDLFVVGWELVGLTSALLIGFFAHRPGPARHGLRAFVTYRVCDLGLLAGLLWLHHTTGTTRLMGLALPGQAFDRHLIGLLLVLAAMGKSAQFPVGGWLPRAMEGPTPSSAIFYGAISIHLGPLLLLRVAPLIASSWPTSLALVLTGSVTAVYATVVGRVQPDVKNALAYASMTQSGLIFVELGLGFEHLALLHMLGHGLVRTLEILRSPSLLHDYHELEQALGELPRMGAHLERIFPPTLQSRLYALALARFYVDEALEAAVAAWLRLARGLDGLERRFSRWLG
ncbi:MAG: proton-conducting transporter membrane subunit [Vulcanimicrobiota bacterium]